MRAHAQGLSPIPPLAQPVVPAAQRVTPVRPGRPFVAKKDGPAADRDEAEKRPSDDGRGGLFDVEA
jgi:hypothetical protein